MVEDFHFRDLSYGLQSTVLVLGPSRAEYLLVRIASDSIPGTIATIQSVFAKTLPGRPFEYSFLDDKIRAVYSEEERQAEVVGYSSFLAILIALIGLFGLVLYIAEQRTREIGIRKVFGASSNRIAAMLAAEFALLVLVANIIALPVAFYFLNEWLMQYRYRISWNPSYFAAAIGVSVVLALLTVSYQAFKSASANPVECNPL